jgi:hypothetical protein
MYETVPPGLLLAELQEQLPWVWIYLVGWLVAVLLIAYLYKKYTDLARLFIEEKLTALKYIVPALEQLIPILPDKYREQATLILGVLKEMKSINEALQNLPTAEWLPRWRGFAAKLEEAAKRG